MLEASNLKTMESWYQNLSPYVNDKEFPLRGGKKDLPPVLIGLKAKVEGGTFFLMKFVFEKLIISYYYLMHTHYIRLGYIGGTV